MALPYLPGLANSHNGNYVLQAIVRFGTRLQQTQIWLSACPQLFVMCADPYGSRVVHTMLDFLPSNGADLEYIAFSISNCLSSNFSYFFKRSSGVRVITKCLRKLNHPCMKFLYNDIVSHCFEMATDQNGALLLQACISIAISHSEHERNLLLRRLVAKTRLLSDNPYGNYVVQCILDLQRDLITKDIVQQLKGKVNKLARQKYGSNVIEKAHCLRVAGQCDRQILIAELLQMDVSEGLSHNYANYCV
ncbi:armadillo-type protein, partial [Favolaschia claudopus]